MKKLWCISLLSVLFSFKNTFSSEQDYERMPPAFCKLLEEHLETPLNQEEIKRIFWQLLKQICMEKGQTDKEPTEDHITIYSFNGSNCYIPKTPLVNLVDGLNQGQSPSFHYQDISLICQRAGLPLLAQKAGDLAICHEEWLAYLVRMSERFIQGNLHDLALKAAEKSFQQIQTNFSQSRMSSYIDIYRAAQTFERLEKADWVETTYVYCLKNTDSWSHLFELYQSLNKLQANKLANEAFDKLIEITVKDRKPCSPNLFSLFAEECLRKRDPENFQKAFEYAIDYEGNMNNLMSAIKLAKSLSDERFTDQATNKFKNLFERNATFDTLKKYYPEMLSIDPPTAQTLCKIILKKCNCLRDFPILLELITFLHENKEASLLSSALNYTINLCTPEKGPFIDLFISGAFIPSSTCLLLTSQLSDDINQQEFALQATDRAIDCLLVEPQENPQKLLGSLQAFKDVVSKLSITLTYPRFLKKVDYYAAEIESPSFHSFPLATPELFDIYWVKFKNTKGAEIKKKRPWVVISKPRPYNSNAVVTMLPLSTKKRGGFFSFPISLPVSVNDEPQEIRLDQVRSADISRLSNKLGTFPEYYQRQLLLAYKNSVEK
jgi:mRNA-degrading endonuclease toxin of MazEF toxin-antitoxin module